MGRPIFSSSERFSAQIPGSLRDVTLSPATAEEPGAQGFRRSTGSPTPRIRTEPQHAHFQASPETISKEL